MQKSFERTYPHYAFSELVGLGIFLVGRFAQAAEKNAAPRPPAGATPATHHTR